MGSHNASNREDHTGSRAIEWFSEINRRAHTCLMDAGIHAHTVMYDKDKNVGSVNSIVLTEHHDLPEMT